ncbi:MAG: hypothetical protein DMF51_12020 [Acidobacteria bacterium]|nr:MAG: hypothetical protein DMF51_12020 [Acidobacteriota bacterium]
MIVEQGKEDQGHQQQVGDVTFQPGAPVGLEDQVQTQVSQKQDHQEVQEDDLGGVEPGRRLDSVPLGEHQQCQRYDGQAQQGKAQAVLQRDSFSHHHGSARRLPSKESQNKSFSCS